MKEITHFMLPEHTNNLYEKEAISSIALTRDVADKINELVDAYNEVATKDLEKFQELEGTVRKGVLYMKDNLLNSMSDLMELLRDSGFIDDRIEYHCKHLKERLDNFLNESTDVSTNGAEIIDGRVDFTGVVWNTIGEHIRALFESIGSQGVFTREQVLATYNNLNYKDELKAGDRVYVEPLSIDCAVENINYITIYGMYGDLAEDGTDVLGWMIPENIHPAIYTLERDYAGIRITYALKDTSSTTAHGIIKKLGYDLTSLEYENRVKVYNTRSNYHLFEPVKMRYGAHQGYRLIAPANSIPAYEEMGKAGFEWCWIAGCRQSADGTWFVMHDATVDATTNGTGAIKEMTDAQIGNLVIDIGTNKDKYTASELKVPTVEEVIKICHKYGVNICFRMMSIYGNSSGIDDFQSLIKLVKKHGVENSIFSGSLKHMEMLKAFTDNWHGQVYLDTDNTQEVYDMIDTFVSKGWTNMSILTRYSATTREVVEYCHLNGYKYCVSDIPTELNVDTVINNLQAMGVDICQSGGTFKK